MPCLPRVGDQLEMWPGLLEEERRLPWGGRSPRGLTRVAMSPIFKARAAKKDDRFDLTGQIDLWPAKKKAPGGSSPGAPLLLDLPKRR